MQKYKGCMNKISLTITLREFVRFHVFAKICRFFGERTVQRFSTALVPQSCKKVSTESLRRFPKDRGQKFRRRISRTQITPLCQFTCRASCYRERTDKGVTAKFPQRATWPRPDQLRRAKFLVSLLGRRNRKRTRYRVIFRSRFTHCVYYYRGLIPASQPTHHLLERTLDQSDIPL